MELETLLSAGERAPPSPPVSSRAPPTSDADLLSRFEQPRRFAGGDDAPARRADPGLSEPAVAAASHLSDADASIPPPSTTTSLPSPSPAVAARPPSSVRRLMQELRACASPSVMGPLISRVDLFPSEIDLGFWRFTVDGREETPYEGGTWLMSVRFPVTYPLHAPEIRFQTPSACPRLFCCLCG